MQGLKHFKASSNFVALSKTTNISGVAEVLLPIINRFAVESNTDAIKSITAYPFVSSEVKQKVNEVLGVSYESHDDGYVILRNGDSIIVSAENESGLQTGLMTFLQLLEDGSFGYDAVYDWPIYSTRGIKLMMPGRDEIDDFKKFIDTMVYFRHNIVMLEIGGAMEYKRHPEINEGWEEYAAFMMEYSGKSNQIQNNTYPWRKNSIHSNNGGGSYLTQDEIKGIISYCKARNIEIIPEVPSTSHCDYMLTRHPELAERCEDPFPDTFCPSNPASYDLLFDILDEVIDVFEPEIINIGHDEYYSINVCDRCRKRLMDAADIYTEDVTKIHDYLASKGVKTMIWCDKLLDVKTVSGANFGGALNYVYFQWNVKGKLLGIIPATYTSREKLPRDIICLNWMWSYGPKYDEDLREYPVMFGNFKGSSMTDFRKRCGNNTSGGICSNWGATSDVYLQRNNMYFEMAYNDILYFNGEYDDSDNEQFVKSVDKVFNKLFTLRNNEFKEKHNLVEVCHSADAEYTYHSFCDGEFASGDAYMEKYLLGHYLITYADGTSEQQPVILGENVGTSKASWHGSEISLTQQEDGATGGLERVKMDSRISETVYSTLPCFEGSEIFYRYMLPTDKAKTVAKVEFIAKPDAKFSLDVKSIKL